MHFRMSTDEVQAQKRLKLINEISRLALVETEARALTEDVAAHVELSRIGTAYLLTSSGCNVRSERSRGMISRSDASFATFCFGGSRTVGFAQGGRDAGLERGAFLTLDVTQPFDVIASLSPTTGLRTLQVPREAIGGRMRLIEDCSATGFDGSDPVQRIACDFTTSLFREVESGIDEKAGQLLVNQSVELLLLAIERRSGLVRKHAPSAYKAALTQRLKQFVEENLRSPRLTIAAAAAELRISERYVNLLLNQEDTSFGKYVLSRRLERCRAELHSLEKHSMQIGEIAYDWGFVSHAHFSRVFRERYGLSPKELRNI